MGVTYWGDFVIQSINQEEYKKVVEVGVWKGDLTRSVLAGCRSITDYWAVDPWIVYTGKGAGFLAEKDQNYWDAIYRRVHDEFSKDRRVHILRLPSVEAASSFELNSLDFVFIDADHTEIAVRNDIQAWLPLVRNGGTIAGHDYHHEEVTKGVDSVLKGVSIKLWDDGGSGFSKFDKIIPGQECWFYRKQEEVP